MFMNTGRRVGPAAGAQGDLSAFEMAEELLPFLFCRGAVFLAGPQRPSSGDEGAVTVDDFFGVDGLVAHRDVDVAVARDELGDVGWHAVHDRVGDQDSAEIVGREPQRFAAGVGDALPVRALLMSSRMAGPAMGRFSPPKWRWNSSGIGGFQTRSW